MAQVMLINPRRKRRAKKTAKRRAVRRNPRTSYKTRRRWSTKARPRRRSVTMRVNPRRRSRRMRRNPRSLTSVKGFLNGTLIPGSVGALGALGLDVALGFLPLPAVMQSGIFKPVVRLGGAMVLGMVASKIANRKIGEQVAAGATIVVLYDMFKGFAQTALPALPLSGIAGYPNLEYYSAGMPVGEYVSRPMVTQQAANGVVQPVQQGQSMGEYVYG